MAEQNKMVETAENFPNLKAETVVQEAENNDK